MKSRFLTLLVLATLVFLLPPAAQAQTNNVAEVLGCVASWLYGDLGQVIGVLAVVAVGVTAMFGRIQVSTVLTVMAGLALMLGAETIVKALGITLTGTPATCGGAQIIQSPIFNMFSCLIKWFTGPMGKGLATLAIIALGVFATYGKISYQQAIVVGVGIATIFGSVTIIEALGQASQNGACAGNLAGTPFALVNAFCSMANWFTKDLGQGVATLAIITLGIGALYGKVSWPMGLIFGVGTALVFGAETIVEALGAGHGDGCSAATNLKNDKTFTALFCSVISWFQGPMGMGLATLGIIAMGVGALYGKISWPTALVVGLGTALVFGGSTIVTALGTASSGATGCYAPSTTPGLLADLFCNVVGWFSGPMGAGMATLAIIILGVGALYGKVSWPMAMIVGLGVAMVFGATTVIESMGGGALNCGNMNAVTPSALATLFCNISGWVNGPLGKGIATLAIIITGFAALSGKITWPSAIIVAVGVSLVFGATSVVSSLGGNGLERCARGELANTTQPGGQITPISPVTPLPNRFPTLGSTPNNVPGLGGYTFGSAAGGGVISYPSAAGPGTLTVNPYGSVMIPQGTKAGDVIKVGNGWTLTMPGPGVPGSIEIPGDPQPLASTVIPIPAQGSITVTPTNTSSGG